MCFGFFFFFFADGVNVMLMWDDMISIQTLVFMNYTIVFPFFFLD